MAFLEIFNELSVAQSGARKAVVVIVINPEILRLGKA